jgi:hypothetical protein
VKWLGVVAAIAALCVLGSVLCGCSATGPEWATSSTISPAAGDTFFAQAFAGKASGQQGEGQGTVTRLLPDDTSGDRHQRFIVKLASGQTLLIAHNIDVAPRVEGLQVGDAVSFKGQYEWNNQGGLVHWTHRDPRGRHLPGWITFKGKTYQ